MLSAVRENALTAQAPAVRARFEALGAAQFSDAVDDRFLKDLLEPWLGLLRQVAVRNEVRDHFDDHVLVMGGRHSRVDAGHPTVNDASGELMTQVLRRCGVETAAARLAAQVRGPVESIVGAHLSYARVQVLLYGADDYLGPHTDARSGARYNVQAPLNGPGVWHEVLPLVPTGPAARPHRVVLSLRFESP
jgi:hypothetical protein